MLKYYNRKITNADFLYSDLRQLFYSLLQFNILILDMINRLEMAYPMNEIMRALSSAMAALSDMLDSSDCSNDLEYNYHFPSNIPITSPSFNFSNSPSLGNFNTGSSPSYNYPSQTDAGCYGMKTEAGMYGLKREVCYNGVKTETEQQHMYRGQSNSTTTKENFTGLSVKESYGLSPTSVLDYGSPPSSPPLADGWPMGEFLAWHMIFCCVTLTAILT